MLSKDQKTKFVQDGSKELKKYSLVGIIHTNGIPDRLLQSSRNRLKGKVHLIMGRKTMLKRILESDARTKELANDLQGTSAIVMSNEDPFDLFGMFKAGAIKLAAKPNQIAPDDIVVQAAETTLQPGQAVTELKQAGIDVQIQKGKVVIAKDKVIVKKGDVITTPVAKALHTLNVMPFVAYIAPAVELAGSMRFTKELLDIDVNAMVGQLAHGFQSAIAICMETGTITPYTVEPLIAKAVRSAIAVGTEAKVYEPGIVERLIAEAANAASALNGMAGETKTES
ncbi:MAG: 50S ribosomal protein L10 [Candidatus Micrarchaeota archaeon]|nr:50S ribosomal protein L10 [Candidatus Micrarchaeota archaeon]